MAEYRLDKYRDCNAAHIIEALTTFVELDNPNINIVEFENFKKRAMRGLCFGESQLWALHAIEGNTTLLNDVIACILEWRYNITTNGEYRPRSTQALSDLLDNDTTPYLITKVNKKKRLLHTTANSNKKNVFKKRIIILIQTYY